MPRKTNRKKDENKGNRLKKKEVKGEKTISKNQEYYNKKKLGMTRENS